MRRWFVVALVLIGTAAAGAWYRTVSSSSYIDGDIQTHMRAVHERPDDPEAWLALGDAQSALDALSAAEQAYRTAIEVSDAAGQGAAEARARLGFLLYQRGQDEQARRWLKEAHERGARVPLLDEILGRLAPETESVDAGLAGPPTPARDRNRKAGVRPSPGDRWDAGFGEQDAAVQLDRTRTWDTVDDTDGTRGLSDVCAVPLKRRASGALLVDTVVNGVEMVLLVDTGATMTVLNRSAADDARLRWLPGRLIAQTANGQAEMRLGRVNRIELGDRIVDDLRVAVCDECISTIADGLMGVDVQARFDVRVDVVAQQLLFADCD